MLALHLNPYYTQVYAINAYISCASGVRSILCDEELDRESQGLGCWHVGKVRKRERSSYMASTCLGVVGIL